MKVDKLALDRIFDRTERLEAPLFQRPYVWQRTRNWEPLWNTIRSVAEARFDGAGTRKSFLGALVLDQIDTPMSRIHARQIIDGQQRLTTFQLILAAARDLCMVLGEERYAQAFRKLTLNDVPLSENPDDRFKVWPTNADRRIFRQTLTAGNKKDVIAIADDHSRIPLGYLFFYHLLEEWLGAPVEETFLRRVEALYQSLREDLQLVVIDLESDDDPQEIFETLNALGTPLLPADLIKNFLFRMAQTQGLNPEKLDAQYWKDFDREISFWREEVRQGRLRRPRYDLFVQHYLTLKTKEEVGATELFKVFKDYVGANSEQSAADLMASFRTYGRVYRDFEVYPDNSREGIFFYRLEQLDTSTVFPLLLEVLHRFGDPDHRAEVDQILTDIESFLVRRAVCELTTKNYNRLFVEMLKATEQDLSAVSIRKCLLASTADASRWPDDKEFEKAWVTVDFYRKVKRSKLRMILEALDDAHRSSKTEIVRVDKTLTVEHVMPVQWEKNWPMAAVRGNFPRDLATERRNEAVNKIGNLTLLTRSLNPAVSNASWTRKRQEILKHSAINMNRYFLDVEVWDEAAIEARTVDLFRHATKTWPHPIQTEEHS
jgi:hypothetical protein